MSIPRALLRLRQEFSLPAGRNCLEITAHIAISRFERAVQQMASVRAEGFLPALDDLGAGVADSTVLRAS